MTSIGVMEKDLNILIYSNQNKPRIFYTMDFIFRCVNQVNFKITSDRVTYNNYQGPKFNYSNKLILKDDFQIIPSGLLLDIGIYQSEVNIEYRNKITYLDLKKWSNSSFDPFSTIFYCISRYEEYLPFKGDQHDRFQKENSQIRQIIDIPIVDLWINWLNKKLNKKYSLHLKTSTTFLPTYDIDHVRAFQWKGVKRSLGGIAKDILSFNWNSLKERISVLTGKTVDPYDVFHFFSQLEKDYKLSPIYFWLLGDHNNYDKNPSVHQPQFREFIKSVSSKNEVGIHLSYGSYLESEKMKKEIEILSSIIGKKINKNRFHFLKMSLPTSYQQLIDLGIKDDYSMGYADRIGFRAGTSHSFYWYNLAKEEMTSLKIHPFQIMDVSLKNYMNLSPEEGLIQSKVVIEKIKINGGQLVTLWHNSSFKLPEWNNWKSVYLEIIKEGINLNPDESS